MVLLSTITYGQTSFDYAFKNDVQVYLWDDATQGVVVNNIMYRAKGGDEFTVHQHYTITINGKQVSGWRFQFWDFKSDGTQIENNHEKKDSVSLAPSITVIKIGKQQNGKDFFVTDDDLKNIATTDFRKPTAWLKVDGLVLPMKIRFRTNQSGGVVDFTQSINIGIDIAKTWNKGGAFGTTSYSFLGGVNITNVPVDQTTVPGVITSKTTLLGLTPNIGFNLEYKSINFGIMTGIDILSGTAESKWAYRNSPWLGLSIGTSLTNVATPSKKQN